MWELKDRELLDYYLIISEGSVEKDPGGHCGDEQEHVNEVFVHVFDAEAVQRACLHSFVNSAP